MERGGSKKIGGVLGFSFANKLASKFLEFGAFNMWKCSTIGLEVSVIGCLGAILLLIIQGAILIPGYPILSIIGIIQEITSNINNYRTLSSIKDKLKDKGINQNIIFDLRNKQELIQLLTNEVKKNEVKKNGVTNGVYINNISELLLSDEKLNNYLSKNAGGMGRSRVRPSIRSLLANKTVRELKDLCRIRGLVHSRKRKEELIILLSKK